MSVGPESRESVTEGTDVGAVETAPVSPGQPNAANSPPDVDVEGELQEPSRQALEKLGFASPDSEAIMIVNAAARLTTGDDQGPISGTRLFIAAVTVGEDNNDPRSYLAALAKVVHRDSSFSGSYRNFGSRFWLKAADIALEQVRPQWFDRDVHDILEIAAREQGNLRASDAIVRTLLRYPSSLEKQIQIDRLARAVEAELREQATPPPSPLPTSVMEEIDALLAALEIEATDDVRRYLLWGAANRRNPAAALYLSDVMGAIVETDPGRQGLPTDPTELLRDIARQEVNTEVGSKAATTHLSANPDSPLRFATNLEILLRRGFDLQRRIFLNPRLGTKGLLAAAFTTPEQQVRERAEIAGAVERFRALVRERLPAEEMRRWNRALERDTRSLPRLNTDQPGLGSPRDMMGVTRDALAIANVAAGKSTSLPLAFGIFGDWGAGKSFFMRLIQEQVASFVPPATAAPAKPAASAANPVDNGFEHAIVQIQFNAWHYAETNLWASLVGHIFEELDRWMTRGQQGTSNADALLNKLSTARQLTLEAATELMQRRKEHAKAGAKLGEAQTALAAAEKTAAEAPGTVWRTVVATAKNKIAEDPEIKRELAGIEGALQVQTLSDNKAALTSALDQLDKATSAGRAALGALRGMLGDTYTIVFAVGMLIGVPLLLLVCQTLVNAIAGQPVWADIGSGVQSLAGLLAGATVLLRSFTAKAKWLSDKFVDLKTALDKEVAQATETERAAAQKAAADVAQSAAAVEQARTVVRATGEQVGAALKEYAEETGSLRISRFVRARAGADGYGKHLGLVSTIRKDFDQLESLMLDDPAKTPPAHLEEARKHYEARVKALIKEAKIDEAKPALEPDEIARLEATTGSMRSLRLPPAMAFRRIVLYIDDLDRCEPAKVVEVLQAVNMLLTFRLFVVMVAVDARWLSRSLEKQYPEFFGVASKDDDEDELNGKAKAKSKTKAKSDGGNGPREASTGEDEPTKAKATGGNGPRRATTADYLEKIFQIPYWVPAMDEDTSRALVGDLVAADRAAAALDRQQQQEPDRDRDTDKDKGKGREDTKDEDQADEEKRKPVVQDKEDDQPMDPESPPESLTLTPDEMESLTSLAPCLGGSPRRARRFVNVYRVAKASLRRDEVKQLESGAHRALATQLAIATGAPNAFAAWVEICTDRDPDVDDATIDARVADIDVAEEERDNITAALKAFREMLPEGTTDGQAQLARQARRAGRFSFAMPSKGLAALPTTDT